MIAKAKATVEELVGMIERADLRQLQRQRHYVRLANRNKRELLACARAALGSQMFPIGNIYSGPPATQTPQTVANRPYSFDASACE